MTERDESGKIRTSQVGNYNDEMMQGRRWLNGRISDPEFCGYSRKMDEGTKCDYHSGMEAALKSKYDDRFEFMEMNAEVKIGQEAPFLDLLVLKKDSKQQLSDEIGQFFKAHNVIENKGYGNGISINDVFKAQGYAGMCMAVDRKVDEIPWEQVTVSIIQYQYPQTAFKRLQQMGCNIVECSTGIYEISGPAIGYPLQVVDAVKIGQEWAVLKALIPGASESTISAVQNEYDSSDDPRIKQHLKVILDIALGNNQEIYKKLREDRKMNAEAINYVFGDEIRHLAEELKNTDKEASIEKMLRARVSTTDIMDWLSVSADKIVEVAKKMGMETLAL